MFVGLFIDGNESGTNTRKQAHPEHEAANREHDAQEGTCCESESQ